jgi:hypothetical protein
VLLKGALIEFMPTFLIPVPNVIVFQYNPETLTHTWSQPEAASPSETTTNWPMAVKGMPGESFSFTIAVDANDEIADGSAPTAAIALVSGVYSRLAALEMLLYPTGPEGSGLLGAVSAAAAATFSDASSSEPTTSVPASTMPVVLFVWGPVLTPAELQAAGDDQRVLGTLATVAYDYTLGLRQALAVANLADAGESIIGMITH